MMRATAALAAALTAAAGLTLPAVARTDTAPAGRAPLARAVPAPTADTSVVTVRVGGDRTGPRTVGPLAGV
ncbi:hypothetical protein ACFV1L_36025, partial [Kitasatospora sp. NPDC059646]